MASGLGEVKKDTYFIMHILMQNGMNVFITVNVACLFWACTI